MSRPTQTISRAMRFYLPRCIGLSLGFLAVSANLAGTHPHRLALGLLVTYCFVWPHLAYLIARASARPGRTERGNMLFDAFAAGLFAGAIGFNPIPSVAVITMVSMNDMAMGGPRFMALGACASALGAALAWGLFGTPFNAVPSQAQIAACLPLLVLYPLSLGYVCYRTTIQLARQKKQLREMSRTDHLTGLSNRAALNEILDTAFRYPCDSLNDSVIALIDADGFKQINDRFGHLAGDQALQNIAEIMRSCVRADDTVGRYGGDEFCVILRHVNPAQAAQILERMRVLAQQSIADAGGEQRSTLSIGAAVYTAEARTGAMWLHLADEAMYEAKRAGRNKVVFAASASARTLLPTASFPD